jgi:3-hydroxyisobutyrate dehydrogenase-like beta-hydroxyacid dehydrogenase
MTNQESTVAIIGTGNLGGTLAANFAAGGQDFLLAGRDQEIARKLASNLDGHAEVVDVDEAVDRADVLVVAVWLDAFKQLIAAGTLSAAARREPERGLDQSIRIEMFGDLHEFGALGRAVTKSEALKAI